MCTSAAEQQDSSKTIPVWDDYSRERQEPQQRSNTEEAGWKTPSGEVYGLYPTSPLYIPLLRDRCLELSGAGNRSRGISLYCTRRRGLLKDDFK